MNEVALQRQRVEERPEDAHERIEYARLLLRDGHLSAAQKQLSVALSLSPADKIGTRLLARVESLQRRGAARKRQRLVALKAQAEEGASQAIVGYVRQLRGSDAAQSLAAARTYAAQHPGDQSAGFLLAESLIHSCRFQEAFDLAEKLAAANPTEPRPLILAGRAAMRLGAFARAIPFFEEASRKSALVEDDTRLLEQARAEVTGVTGRAQVHNDSITRFNIGYTARFSEAVEIARTTATEPLRVLSFGCSRGSEVGVLKEVAPNALVFGCDVDEASMFVARETQQDGRTKIVHSDHIDPYGPFDVVTCMSVLCRFPASERVDDLSTYLSFQMVDSLMTKIAGLLRPGGVLVLWNANYCMSDMTVGDLFSPAESNFIGINGYASMFAPDGRRLTRFHQAGLIKVQDIIGDINPIDVVTTSWIKSSVSSQARPQVNPFGGWREFYTLSAEPSYVVDRIEKLWPSRFGSYIGSAIGSRVFVRDGEYGCTWSTSVVGSAVQSAERSMHRTLTKDEVNAILG